MGQLGKVGVTTHAELTDVSTPHALADLVAAVCSETEAATLIAAAKTTGTYVGDATANRAIPHGLGVTPKVVLIVEDTGNAFFFKIYTGVAKIFRHAGDNLAVTAMNGTNFYVGNAADYTMTANTGTPATVYYWVAIG